jgi:nucleoside-diphosphate-sugar epimerase
MRRLIIGCGYLGKRVAARWLADGDSVAALTRSPENAEGLRSRGITPVLGDVMQPETLAALPEVDTVLWAVGWDRSSGISQRDVYVTGLQNILRQVAGRCSRVIYISSTSVYGQSHGEWIDETSICEPAQPNGQACLDAESSLQPWLPGSGARPIATVMRLSGIYGPDRLLSRAATLKSGEPLAGNPEAWLNLIHVDDAADAVVTCAAATETRPLFLISDNEPMPRRAYYSALAELVGAPPPRFAEEEFEATAPARGTRTVGLNKRCNNSLIKDFLQWAPRFPTYREGLNHAVNGEPSA